MDLPRTGSKFCRQAGPWSSYPASARIGHTISKAAESLKDIRIGLIGTGGMGKALQRWAGEFGFARWTTSWWEVVADPRVDPHNSEINTFLETKPNDRVAGRSWNYVTVGYGHSELWWRDFVVQLKQNGYDDVLSTEHEDFNLPPIVGV